jgi:peroxiredoxin
LLLIITTGDPETNGKLFEEHKVGCPVLLQKGSEVAEVYKANGTPSGYLIDADGRIASDLAMGADALLALLDGKTETRKQKEAIEQGASETVAGNGHDRDNRFKERSLARSKIKRDGLKAGTAAPEFRLPRVDGRGELELSELRGRKVLLVFSSPGCGPCNTLAPELEKFHRAHPELEVVMISKGEPKENRAKVKEHRLTFPVVLQQQWEISRRYAMFATPVAYLIDEQGIISRDVAVGVEPIVALMGDAVSARELEAVSSV